MLRTKKKKEATNIFEVMEKKTFLLHNASSNDLHLDIWFSSHLFKWDRNIFSIMDANKNCSGAAIISL